MHFLSQARGVRSALVNRQYCTDVSCEWVSCLVDVKQRDDTIFLFEIRTRGLHAHVQSE